MTSIDRQVEIIMQGSEFGDAQTKEAMTEELRQRLIESSKLEKPLRVYAGYDATAPDLHLGHSITLRKLREFQDFGHHVIFLVGTFTARVGDTSDKDTSRPQKSVDEVEIAAKTYARQCFKILKSNQTEVAYNADWLVDLKLSDIVKLASNFTVQQFLAKENYRARIDRGNPVGLQEFLYALLQGYDAVHLRADVQIGATEQLFNILAGRKLQAAYGQRPCVCITYPILVGTDGRERMSKSKGNYIGLCEPEDTQFGKIMSLSDETMIQYVELVTRWSLEKVRSIKEGLRGSTLHPMEVKKQLAFEIVSMYHGERKAKAAREKFERIHQYRDVPKYVQEFQVSMPVKLIDVMVAAKLAKSKSQARRLIRGAGVKLDGEVIEDIDLAIEDGNVLLQVGKRSFLKLVKM